MPAQKRAPRGGSFESSEKVQAASSFFSLRASLTLPAAFCTFPFSCSALPSACVLVSPVLFTANYFSLPLNCSAPLLIVFFSVAHLLIRPTVDAARRQR